MNFWNIALTEFAFVVVVILGLGFVAKPRFMMRRNLMNGFPWGYYADQVPQGDPALFPGNDKDFLHDTGTAFGGLEGFGEYGEFSGFGQLGEYGNTFFTGGVDATSSGE
ncbi:MAG: hypothetical protein LCH63_00655 [Candidatus Melainabacteria bacterium]|jgi:hypothetical protein|uniref:Uncharacterized protein n=1 Tax=Candidatus Obscuribacter phosphatis TaxID=1906157 RepID=A0A8J7PDG0_9BACT|nr:hypothetical protein [Candidatus Obscuribacter phosphatis]MCA0312329.1 hypothetical protein [Candidatus Melainabacteria bacterium]OPZ83901.1 MAG: hypothetical protein BWY75_02886 [bacterium ADurb.Bin425]